MFYLILIIWIILDLYSKNLALNFLQEKINILWDFLYLQYVENTGIAFSTQIPFLKILTIILIIVIFVYYLNERKKEKNKSLIDLAFWLILAWAIWNWIERILYWKVIDFLWVKYFSVFNLADSFISIWAIILIYYYYKKWIFDQKK